MNKFPIIKLEAQNQKMESNEKNHNDVLENNGDHLNYPTPKQEEEEKKLSKYIFYILFKPKFFL